MPHLPNNQYVTIGIRCNGLAETTNHNAMGFTKFLCIIFNKIIKNNNKMNIVLLFVARIGKFVVPLQRAGI